MRGGGHKDEERTKLKHETGEYENPNSYIRLDGAEFLFGRDWQRRRGEVLERDGHRCVTCMKLLTMDTLHTHHIKERSKGGTDNIENLASKCSQHHIGSEGEHP